jgi:hypothetical protein
MAAFSVSGVNCERMLNGVVVSESLAAGVAVSVALVAALLVYRDARRHGNYHALSATGAVAIAGLVGYAVGGVVGLFVGTGYVLLLYLLSYPTTRSVDPSGPQGDAGETIASEDADDTLSVIRVEVATYETLQELAEQYDDVPADAPEAKLRSALRVKALSEVDTGSDGPGAADTRPGRGLSDPDAPAARAGEYGIEEWSRDAAAEPHERADGSTAAEWTENGPTVAESAVDDGVAAWSSGTNDADAAARDADASEQSTADATQPMTEPTERPTSAQERATDLPERNDELAAGAQQWVAANVDRGLGVTVGEALDTPDTRDDPEVTESDAGIDDWSSDEPPAETETATDAAAWSGAEPPAETATEQHVADWSDDPAAANDSEESVTADGEADTESDAVTATGGVWDTAGETTERPDSEQATGMVFDNAIEREETGSERIDTEKPAQGSENTEPETESNGTEAASASSKNAESDSSGDDDPFDGRGELYDGDGNAPSSSQP